MTTVSDEATAMPVTVFEVIRRKRLPGERAGWEQESSGELAPAAAIQWVNDHTDESAAPAADAAVSASESEPTAPVSDQPAVGEQAAQEQADGDTEAETPVI